jgi:uncharacterized protein (DUF983 family)
MPNPLQRARRTAWNGLCLRCPRCGQEKLFRGLFRMKEDCGTCGLHYEREAGYFVGAIYVNYAATTVVSLAGFFFLDWALSLNMYQQIALWMFFSTVFPLWFFRYSRSLWLALDHIFSPEPTTLRVVDPPRPRPHR